MITIFGWFVCHDMESCRCRVLLSHLHTQTRAHTLSRSQLGRIARLYVRHDTDAMTTKTMKITQLK